MPAAPRLALFDLDHTLLPLDSEYEWARYLVAVGGADAAEIDAHNARWLAAYQAGRLDFAAHARFALGLLARHPRQRLTQWRADFMRDVIVPAIPPATRNLLARHLGAGDLCCIVTATCRFITEPIARELGVPHLLAVEAEHDVHGEFTGALAGVPAYGPGKVLRVLAWLDTLGLAHAELAHATFYSDSRNDLPLLESVGHPVAVNPDPTLRDAAGARGWPVMQLFAAAGVPAA
ncbi:HAD family hydrolase [Cupriavidus alkaliphilus]|uniref:HAD superfamily hydrolase (TIGR01490 family) n=1 Tax=Cupriavidus alkaliphilus TaxID=942866 RepID=A0A7W4VDC1_9BURK|nr:HAD family hydrolase [Cupriavidus alkaliphilus]MBB3009204.1 HAD superfamily hydrolase (TIGR01490 family) [Cupriavidus alkaliphilus]PVY79608.1 HAD superfamily hydrolase (TIGR01490 family) [Cupriavidus alkaliphilus]SCB22307.1 HAD-superfamily subfamily IB hydrolase, TIGR01490 [Cupriavidus alkaliphilus]